MSTPTRKMQVNCTQHAFLGIMDSMNQTRAVLYQDHRYLGYKARDSRP